MRSRRFQRGQWEYAIGAIGAGLLSAFSQESTNESNVNLNKENRDWQERMSNTAYQRQVADMAAAGINPMLSSRMGGASAPGNAAPVVQNAIGAGVSSALQAGTVMQGASSIDVNSAQAENLRATARKTDSETLDRDINSAAALARIGVDKETISKIFAERGKTEAETDILRRSADSQVSSAASSAKSAEVKAEREKQTLDADIQRARDTAQLVREELPRARAEADFWKDTGPLSKYLQAITGILRGFSSGASVFRSMGSSHIGR